MIEYLPDTNVFSRIFKGDSVVTQYVAKLEKQKIKKALDNFPLLLITPEMLERAIELIDRYSNSHGLLLADALIAAAALENDLIVLTYNVNDFQFIGGLKWQKPPV